MKLKLSKAEKSKTTAFSRVFYPKKSTIFSGNQSWIFGQKSVNWDFLSHFETMCELRFMYLGIKLNSMIYNTLAGSAEWTSINGIAVVVNSASWCPLRNSVVETAEVGDELLQHKVQWQSLLMVVLNLTPTEA